jgi:hypothetical protein
LLQNIYPGFCSSKRPQLRRHYTLGRGSFIDSDAVVSGIDYTLGRDATVIDPDGRRLEARLYPLAVALLSSTRTSSSGGSIIPLGRRLLYPPSKLSWSRNYLLHISVRLPCCFLSSQATHSMQIPIFLNLFFLWSIYCWVSRSTGARCCGPKTQAIFEMGRSRRGDRARGI